MMDEETLRQLVSETRSSADVRLAFGESRQIGEKTVIPVASVAWGGGSGFGRAVVWPAREGDAPEHRPGGTGGGQGSGYMVRPIAVIEVTPSETKIRPVVNSTQIALAGMLLGGWNVFWIARMLQAIFRNRR